MMLFIAWRSWTNLYPQPLGFLMGKLKVLEGLVQGIMKPWAFKYSIMGFVPGRAHLHIKY